MSEKVFGMSRIPYIELKLLTLFSNEFGTTESVEQKRTTGAVGVELFSFCLIAVSRSKLISN